MKLHETKAMLKAWHDRWKGCNPDTVPNVSGDFRKGFEAALAMKEKPKWATFSDYTRDHFVPINDLKMTEFIFNEARK